MGNLFMLIFFILIHVASAEAQSDFFKGKQMRIVVGASAGAASDLYARVVAQHLAETDFG